MKPQEKLLFMVLGLMVSGAYAFPRPTEAQKAEFDRLYGECLRFAASDKALVLSYAYPELHCEAYQELELFGTEILEHIYRKVMELEAGNPHYENASPLSQARRSRVLYLLWTAVACQGQARNKLFPWRDEPIAKEWEGGAEIWNARTEYLLAEWRAACAENRTNDVCRAKGAIASLGLFSFPTLFNELQAGHDDVVDLLEAVGWRSRWRRGVEADPKAFDRRTLLDWWAANRTAYELPRQSPGFKGSADLWKWKRTGK